MSEEKEILMGGKLGWSQTFYLGGRYPLEANKIFSTLSAAKKYVISDATAYAGNIISVIYDDTVENNGVYFVKSVGANGELVKVGSDTSKEKVFIMPEDFFGEMYDEPDENSFVGKIKQEYVTDILENRYTKMLVIDDNSNPQVGEFDYSDEYILKFKIRIEDFSQGLIVEQIQIFEINVNRDSVDFCKVKLQGFTSYFPFTHSMFDEDPQNCDGLKRLMFIDSVLTDGGVNLPEENKQFFKKNMGSFADWNAQEGEAGYIANKPFYFKITETDYVHTAELEYDYSSSISISGYNNYFKIYIENIGSTFIYLPNGIPTYNYDKDVQEYYTEKMTFEVNDFTFTIYSNGGGDSVMDILWSHNDWGGTTDPINIEIIECSVDSKKLSEVYIPDTVLKTIPQTLSDKDKNQLLDNLGIANLPFSGGESENSAVLKGGNNKVTNANEVALGKYNESNNDTMFSIGIGTSDTDRKNAFEVKGNGDIYFNDIKFELVEDTDDEVNNVWNEIIGTSM